MDCVKAAGLFDSYIDGTLSAATLREFEAHLAACPSCAADMASLKALCRSLCALPQPDLPPGFSQSLHEALLAEPAPPRPSLWRRGWVKGAAAAACLLLLIGAFAAGGNILRNMRYYYGGTAYSSASMSAPMPAPAPAAAPDMAVSDSAMMKFGETGIVNDDAINWGIASEEAFEQEAAALEPGFDVSLTASSGSGLMDGGEIRSVSGDTEKQMERKRIIDANLSLRVDDFEQAYHSLTELAGRYGGYVLSSDSYGYDGEKMQRGYIILRVDANRLDDALAEIDALGKVESQSFNTQDITMAYYDIEGRLTQYKTQEQRLLEILRKAETVEDLIQLEAELTRVRAELESLAGQLRYFDQMTALSSINVSLYQPDDNTQTVRLSGWAGFMQELREGFISGINGLLTGLSGLTVGLARLLPALLLLAVVGLIVALFIRRRREK